MEVLIDVDRVVKLEGSPRDLLTVVNALKENGHTPQIRYVDPETSEWTFWQPTQFPLDLKAA